ncbi:MAG: FHA domain-containing protein [Planctomycetes bacterium]|nr:FHA domain-containing protein [Planctomycetota bacterium]
MIECTICGEKIQDGSRTCSVCGSTVDDFMPAGTGLGSASQLAAAPAAPVGALPPGGSYCPGCATVYGPEHKDPYCVCGIELLKELPAGAVVAPPMEELPPPAAILEDAPMAPLLEESPPVAAFLDEAPPLAPLMEEAPPLAPFLDETPALAPIQATPAEEVHEPAMKIRLTKPPSGTPCLVLYGPDKQPLQYFPLTKDATLIGRLDAVEGVFPDVDLDQWFDRPTIRKISRRHALVLRTRQTGAFALRPLAGNTGTQFEKDLVQPLQDYPLAHGTRIILGGVIRLKFEIT